MSERRTGLPTSSVRHQTRTLTPVCVDTREPMCGSCVSGSALWHVREHMSLELEHTIW